MDLYRQWRPRVVALLLSLFFSFPAHAVPSEFDRLVQISTPDFTVSTIRNNLFNRQHYQAAGANVTFRPWVWDEEEEEWVYAVAPGETWTWIWRNTDTGVQLARHEISYLGGDQLCWSNGNCGTFGAWWAALPMQCMAEDLSVTVETYHDGQFLGSDFYEPTLFVPKVAQTFMPESLEPRRTSSAEGQYWEIMAYVTDDLDCERPLPGVQVGLASTIAETATNGQTYFTRGDRGTGEFSSVGYDAVVNPGGEQEMGTVIQGETDENGLFVARYQAQDHGARETITFSVKRPGPPEIEGASVEEELLIAIPGLVQITVDHGPVGFVDGGGCPHDPKPHWLTERTRNKVIGLASVYYGLTNRELSLNDASLPYGGVIANRGGA